MPKVTIHPPGTPLPPDHSFATPQIIFNQKRPERMQSSPQSEISLEDHMEKKFTRNPPGTPLPNDHPFKTPRIIFKPKPPASLPENSTPETPAAPQPSSANPATTMENDEYQGPTIPPQDLDAALQAIWEATGLQPKTRF
jgi:hypothetical protein